MDLTCSREYKIAALSNPDNSLQIRTHIHGFWLRIAFELHSLEVSIHANRDYELELSRAFPRQDVSLVGANKQNGIRIHDERGKIEGAGWIRRRQGKLVSACAILANSQCAAECVIRTWAPSLIEIDSAAHIARTG